MTTSLVEVTRENPSLARVVKVIDDYQVVINRGANQGVALGDRFLVFCLDDAVIDPETGENLGALELVRGRAKVIHIQEKMATLQSTEMEDLGGRKRIIKGGLAILGQQEIIEDVRESRLPLDSEIGDLAKPI